jgi:glycosyltransferase involved in cell wall biosynthesis
MRVLFVVQRYGEDIAGGSEQSCRLFAEHVAALGHNVEVATSCARNYTDWANEFEPGTELINGVTVHRFPVDEPRVGQRFGALDRAVVWGRKPVPLSMQERWIDEMGPRTTGLPNWLSDRAPDIDIAVFFTYLYFTTNRGLPAIAGLTPTLLQPTAHDEPHITVPVFDRLFRLPDGCAFLTPEEAQLVNTRFGRRPVEEVIGIGVDLDRHGDAERFRKAHRIGDAPFLLFIGRVDPGKGSLEAYDYFTAYKERNPGDLRLVIVGDLVTTLPRHRDIICTGFVPEGEKMDALAACTALIQPSYFESFSMALTEAWSMRRPALVQGRCSVLVGQALRSGGALCYDGFAEFEAGVDLLLSEHGLADELGARGYRYVEENYRWDDLIVRYMDLLERTVDAYSRRGVASVGL